MSGRRSGLIASPPGFLSPGRFPGRAGRVTAVGLSCPPGFAAGFWLCPVAGRVTVPEGLVVEPEAGLVTVGLVAGLVTVVLGFLS